MVYRSTSIGKMNGEIDIEKEGKDVKIGFDPKFMIDALRVIDDEVITLYFINSKAPCTIRDEENSYLYLMLNSTLKMVYRSTECKILN